MRKILTFTLTILIPSILFGQSVTELYNNQDYAELIKYENNADQLTSEELFMLGFAFFNLENDQKAIAYYDRAIDKGFENSLVHYYKGISLSYLEKFEDALKEIERALNKEPDNQEYMNQKGLIYKYQGQEDKALEVFEMATKLPNTYGEPFFWVAYLYHWKQDFKKALDLYYVAIDSVPPSNGYHSEALQSVGQLEYSYTKNYRKSAEAYAQAIQMDPGNYELYYKLMKSYNGAQEYAKADSVFGLVKIAFEKGELPAEDMEIKTIPYAQFEWNGQIASMTKSLVEPTEILDISYKVFLLNSAGDEVERRFMVEKTMQFKEGGPNHLLCEQDKQTGGHITYPYGWTGNIPIDDLERVVKLVLDGKMKQSASSQFGKK